MRSNVIRRIAATAIVCLRSPNDLRLYYIGCQDDQTLVPYSTEEEKKSYNCRSETFGIYISGPTSPKDTCK